MNVLGTTRVITMLPVPITQDHIHVGVMWTSPAMVHIVLVCIRGILYCCSATPTSSLL